MKAKPNIIITDVADSDFAKIQQIYAYYVENTTISLEETAPDVAELKSRRKDGYPYLVAKIDGEVVGYAYAFPYRCLLYTSDAADDM
jgi:L-amino acid N-acyltransferase YncA